MTDKEYLVTYRVDGHYDFDFAYGKPDLEKICRMRTKDGYEILGVFEIKIVNDLTQKLIGISHEKK